MARKKRRKRKANKKTLLVTADIGKKSHHIFFTTPDGEEVKPFPVPNSREGFEKLWEKILNFRDRNGLESVLFGFESSGPYAEPLTHFMDARGAKLTQVNPKHTKKYKEVLDNSPEKSDWKDPRVIADIIKMGRGLSVIIPRGHAADLRRLVHCREHLMKHRTMLYNRIHGCLSIVFPEYNKFLDITTKSATWLFREHGTPKKILALGEEELRKKLKEKSRGKLSSAKIEGLFQAAMESIGIQEGHVGSEIEIKHLYKQVESTDGSIKEIEGKMAEILEQIPASRHLLSIPGVGKNTAATLIGEIGDFRNFRSAREVIKLAGLNLYTVSSGKHIGKIRITKRGRGLLRKALYFAVLGMIRRNGYFGKLYKNYIKEGKKPKVAMIILARKLLVIAFALIRDEKDFDSSLNHDEKAA